MEGATISGEFKSPSITSMQSSTPELSDAEVKHQTVKVMEAFLRGVLQKKGSIASPAKAANDDQFKKDIQRPITSRRRKQGNEKRDKEIAQEKVLQKVMRGERPNSRELKRASRDSTGSGEMSQMRDGRYKRSTSFSKAQRFSIVTDLQQQQQLGPQASPHRRASDLTSSMKEYSSPFFIGSEEHVVGDTPITHKHTKSDPTLHSVHAKAENGHMGKGKKKSFWQKVLKRPNHRHKTSPERKPSKMTSIGTQTSLPQSPPTVPKLKRTPSLIKRFSKKKKSPRGHDLASSSEVRSRSLGIESRVEEEPEREDDSKGKSKSLPLSVEAQVKPHSHHHHQRRLHKAAQKSSREETHEDEVVTDGARASKPTHPGTHSHQGSHATATRPKTLNLQKKKPSAYKKIKNFFNLDSDTSSDENEASCAKARILRSESEMSASNGPKAKVTHSESDKKPNINEVRKGYQHRATKSMNDIESDQSLSEIATKLERIAEQYVHLVARKSSTDIFGDKQHVKKSDRIEQFHLHVQSDSVVPTEPIRTPSMKAFYNMHITKKSHPSAKHSPETRETNPHHRRITRNEIVHKPTGSFDSPYTAHGPRIGNGIAEKSQGNLPTTPVHFSASSYGVKQTEETIVRETLVKGANKIVEEIQYIDRVESDAIPSEPLQIAESNDEDFASGFADADGISMSEEETEQMVLEEEIDVYEETTVTTKKAKIPDETDGAVGGVDMSEEPELNEDKLVEQLVKALIERGNKYYNKELEIDETLVNQLNALPYETMKLILGRVFSKMAELSSSSSFRHPEILQIAMIMKMATSGGSILTRLYSWSQSMITSLVQSIGGWGNITEEIEETEKELSSCQDEEPTTSSNSGRRPFEREQSNDELD